jgi:hypothetical protein
MYSYKELESGRRKDVKLVSTIAKMKHVLLLEAYGDVIAVDLPLHAHGLEQEIAVRLPYEGDRKAGQWLRLRSFKPINHGSRILFISFEIDRDNFTNSPQTLVTFTDIHLTFKNSHLPP